MTRLCTTLFILLGCEALAAAPALHQGITFPTLAGPLASTTGDFNDDGHLDLAISNTAVNSVSLLLGNGDGTFGTRKDYTVAGCQPGQTITGDFNRDGSLDLLGTCTLTATIFVLPGKGDGTFGAPLFSKAPFPVVSGFLDGFVQPLTSADVNGDGILDLALIIQTSQTVGLSSPGAVGQTVIMNGNGDGTFGKAVTLAIAPSGTETYIAQLADVNGDGNPDIIGVSFDYNAAGLSNPTAAFLIVALGDGHGGFQLAHSYALGGIPQTGMIVADVNGDGKLDVVFAGLSIAAILNDAEGGELSGVGVFLGGGDGTFTQSYSLADSQTPLSQVTIAAALAPILGTKYPDLLTVTLSQSATDANAPVEGVIAVRPNNGDGTFGAPQNLTTPSTLLPFSLAVGDFNSDGAPDVVSFNFTANLFDLLFNGPVDIFNDIDAIGQSIATYPAGTVSILLSNAPAVPFTDTNAASFKAGSLATSSIATAFGSNLATGTKSASTLPLPLTLAGTSIAVTDSLGVTRAAPLFFVSPLQINYAIPDGTAVNTATITITTAAGTLKVQQPIVSVAPGVFNVSGVAVAQAFTYTGSATPTVTSTFQVNAQGQFSTALINVAAAGSTVYLILYGTGIRNHQSPVTATIGSTAVTAAFAGAQGGYVGEDQINVQLPQSLAGAGLVNVVLSVDGLSSNPVQISLQ